jgi:MATE family multidrug resistance protein
VRVERKLETAPAGGTRELLALAWPLILSTSFWTVQVVFDRVLLGQSGSQSLAAGMASAVMFWTLLTGFQGTAGYATTFVAQYTGAGRPQDVGPVVWQALHFSLISSLFFVALLPLVGPLVALGGHTPALQELEAIYLGCLCLSAPPALVVSSISSFFAGRGDSRTVLVINSVGLGVNALTAYLLIFGHWGFPAWGIAGAGAAAILGSCAAALVSLALFFRPRYRQLYQTAAGWRFDPALFRRLMRYGLPNGTFAVLDALAYTVFLLLVGRLGEVELAATSVAFTINLLCIMPVLGIGQAVEVLVGQRLGADEPDIAERTTWTGLGLSLAFTGAVAVAYVVMPGALAEPFRGQDAAAWEVIRLRVPVLLRFVAVYALFDTANLVLSFALRGAGDTRFVMRVALAVPWPLMVLPTWAVWQWGGDLYWAWAFASVYIMALALAYLFRFRQGKWRTMRVIGPAPAE